MGVGDPHKLRDEHLMLTEGEEEERVRKSETRETDDMQSWTDRQTETTCKHTGPGGCVRSWGLCSEWYLEARPPLVGGMAKVPLLPVVPPESLEDRELTSPRSPDVMEVAVRQGEMSMSNTWQSTTGSSLSWWHTDRGSRSYSHSADTFTKA